METEVDTFIESHPDWYEEEGQLVAGFEFKDFTAVQTIVTEIMKVADEINHHPVVTFGYNTIEIKTVTHDEGDVITEKDFELAEAITKIIAG